MTHVGEEIRPPEDETVPLGRVVVYCLAIMIIAAAIIHFAVAAKYVQQYWLFGASTLVVAWLQALWAIAVIARPSRALLVGGGCLNAVVLAGYILTLTTGDAVGRAPNAAGLSGFGDGLCAALEAIAVAGCAWLVMAKVSHRVRRRRLIMAPAATGGVTAVLLSTALAVASPGSAASTTGSSAAGTGSAMHMPGMSASAMAIKLPTTSPAGDITMPDPDMQMAAGMKMASSAACVATPTAQQQRAAVSLVDTSWKDSEKYQSLAVALAAGYRPITPTGASVVHYLNPSYYRATLMGGPVLDTTDPQSLVYANTPKGAVLVAAMYITSPGGPTPQPGGCLTQWHVHTNLCLTRGLGVVGAVGPGRPTCPAPVVHVLQGIRPVARRDGPGQSGRHRRPHHLVRADHRRSSRVGQCRVRHRAAVPGDRHSLAPDGQGGARRLGVLVAGSLVDR